MKKRRKFKEVFTQKVVRRIKGTFFYVTAFGIINYYLYNWLAESTLKRAQLADFLNLPVDRFIPLMPVFVWIYTSFPLMLVLPYCIFTLPKMMYTNKVMVRFCSQKLGGGRITLFFVRLATRIFDFWEDVFAFVFGIEPSESRAKKIRRQIFISYLVVVFVSCFVYYVFPLIVKRPENAVSLKELPSATLKLLAFVWKTDRPDNTFPSQHASFSFLIAFIFNYLRPRPTLFLRVKGKKSRSVQISIVGALFFIWALAIVFSTFFIKQHLLVDAASGICLGYVVYRIGFSKITYRLYRILAKNLSQLFSFRHNED